MSLIEDLDHLRIRFEDIKEATKNFTTEIGRGGYGPVYRGQLSLSGELTIVAVKKLQTHHRSAQGLKEFLTEIQMLSRYQHQNIVSLVGFCQELSERFLIYEYAERGSLDKYLKPTQSRCPLTWSQRISICVDAARGLDHLHNHVATNQRVIHRDIKSGNILLDHNWKAMIADFGFSKLGRANESVTYLITNPCGTYGYCDPAYFNSGILTKECDVYSFGVVLFEVLCGRLCFHNVNDEHLVPLARRSYQEKMLHLIIDDDLKKYINSYSMNIFSEIAFQCLQDDRRQRPSMALVLRKLEKALKFIDIEDSPELLELDEALGLQKLVETSQIQHFEEVREMQKVEALQLRKLEEALRLKKLEEALRLCDLEGTFELKELEEALGLQKLVERLQIQHFEEAREMQKVEELRLRKLEEPLRLKKLEEPLRLKKLEEPLRLKKLEEPLRLKKLKEPLRLKKLEETSGLPDLEGTFESKERDEALGLDELVAKMESEIGESRIDFEVMEAIYDMPGAPLSNISRDKVYSHLSTGILLNKGKVWFSIDDDGKTQEMISAIEFLPGFRTRPEPESRFSKVVVSPSHEMHVHIRSQFLSSHVTYAAYLVCKSDSFLAMEDIAAYFLTYRLNIKHKSYISYPSKMDDSEWWMFELFHTVSFKRSRDFIVWLKILDRSICHRSPLLIEGIKFLPIPKSEDVDEIEILGEKNEDVDDIEILRETNRIPSNMEWDNRLPSDYKQFLYFSNKEMMKKSQGDVIFPTKEEAYSILARGVLIKLNYEVYIWFWIKKLNGKKCCILPPTPLSFSYEKQLLHKIKRIPSKESRCRIEHVLYLSPSNGVGMRFEVPRGLLSTNTAYGCYLVYKMPQGYDCKTLVEMKFADDTNFAGQSYGNLTNLSMPQIPVIGEFGERSYTRPIKNPETIQLPKKRNDGWLEVTVDKIQEDEGSGYVRSREKKSWKSRVLPCISRNEYGDRSDDDTGINSFTLEPRYFKNINLCIRPVDYLTTSTKFVVQGIEFRPL